MRGYMPPEVSPQCSRCGRYDSVDVRLALCGAIFESDKTGKKEDDIRLWRIPLCSNCALITYRSAYQRKFRTLRIAFLSIAVALSSLMGMWWTFTSWPDLVTRLGVFLAIAVLSISAWQLLEHRLRAAERNGLLQSKQSEVAFVSEGQRIIASLTPRPGEVLGGVWGEFPPPEHKVRTSNTLKKMRFEGVASPSVLLTSQLPVKWRGTKRRKIAAVGTTIGEIEQRLPKQWKPLWEELRAAQPELLLAADSGVEGGGAAPPLHRAAFRNSREEAELLLADNADANANFNGWTALHTAACGNSTETAKLLLAKGAEVDARSKNGETPLHYAAVRGNKEVAEVLLANGAEVDARSNNTESPLHCAATRGHKDLAELLLANGADVNRRGKNGDTPLHCAAARGYKDLAELLLAKGADVYATDNDGRAALHLAAENRRTNVGELLLAKGADVDARDDDGRTPLHMAAENGHKDLAELLLASRADVNVRDKYGDTPLYEAKFHHKDLAEMLRGHGGKQLRVMKVPTAAEISREAADRWQKAAEHGSRDGQFKIGMAYYTGTGVVQDYGQAMRWLREAAERGDSDGQYNLGMMYGKGQGSLRDPISAYQWILVAASCGSTTASDVAKGMEAFLSVDEVAEAKRRASEFKRRQ